MTIKRLQKMIHQKIPLTKQMGLRVIESSAQKVVFSLPHSQNINHVGTVFGGSIAAAQAVCCWGFLLNYFEANRLESLKPVVVLKEGTNRYYAPIKGRFFVVCKAPRAAELEKFKRGLSAERGLSTERGSKAQASLKADSKAKSGLKAKSASNKKKKARLSLKSVALETQNSKKVCVEFEGEYVVYGQ